MSKRQAPADALREVAKSIRDAADRLDAIAPRRVSAWLLRGLADAIVAEVKRRPPQTYQGAVQTIRRLFEEREPRRASKGPRR